MFTISKLRKRIHNGWCYLECDFDVSGIENPFEEKRIWVAVEEQNADMLTDEVYDAFVLVPLMLGIYYKQDVHIDGCISPRLYLNIKHYLLKIFKNFACANYDIDFSVAGTKVIELPIGSIVGTGISCGVDSLLTIYDNYVMEKDQNYKINGLFLFNCGTHGDYENENSRRIWLERSSLNKHCADALGLPMYILDSNFHSFTHKVAEGKLGYLAIYSCALAFQKVVRRYLTSSNLSYDEIADYRKAAVDYDFSEYCESYMPHLVSTERFELIIDGCQYTRAQKVERISDWSIAQKHLNVCIAPIEGGRNCSCCEKCVETLYPLEAIDKIDLFSEVFDKETFNQKGKRLRFVMVNNLAHSPLSASIVKYCREHHVSMPSMFMAKAYVLGSKLKQMLKRLFQK